MAGELQKVAVICIAASAFAKPALGASTFDISGATAFERWNLTAKAARDSWEPGAPRELAANLPQFVTRLEQRR